VWRLVSTHLTNFSRHLHISWNRKIPESVSFLKEEANSISQLLSETHEHELWDGWLDVESELGYVTQAKDYSIGFVGQLRFATKNVTNLRRLKIDLPNVEAISESRVQGVLLETLQANPGLEAVFLNMDRLSEQVVSALAWRLPSLTRVHLNSTKIFYWPPGVEARLGYGGVQGEERRVWPCYTCWQSEEAGRCEKVDTRLDYSTVALQEEPGEEVVERRVLLALRKLRKTGRLEDLHPHHLLDPLAFHDSKCPRGMFFDGCELFYDYGMWELGESDEGDDEEEEEGEEVGLPVSD